MKTLFAIMLISVYSIGFGQKKTITTASSAGITVTDDVRLNQLGLDKKVNIDTIATIPDISARRIISNQETQKRISEEINTSIMAVIEAKGISSDSVDWQRTTIDLENRKIHIALKKN